MPVSPTLRFITEDDAEGVRVLEQRMAAVYSDPASYPPFAGESDQPELWAIVIERALRFAGPCRILEIGAGRSGFHRKLAEAGLWKTGRVHYTAHDVTDANQDYLRERADETFIGSASKMTGTFDIVFHSFVLEHIVRPRAFLDHVFALLPLAGFHIFSCPRYDVPGLAPPSIAHCGLFGRLKYLLFNVRRALSGSPRFPLLPDPAILHGPYFRDADAIHCVALRDILWLHQGRASVTRFRIPAYTLKDRLVKLTMSLHLIIEKNGPNPTRQIPAPPEPG